jgi:hypothetical protein
MATLNDRHAETMPSAEADENESEQAPGFGSPLALINTNILPAREEEMAPKPSPLGQAKAARRQSTALFNLFELESAKDGFLVGGEISLGDDDGEIIIPLAKAGTSGLIAGRSATLWVDPELDDEALLEEELPELHLDAALPPIREAEDEEEPAPKAAAPAPVLLQHQVGPAFVEASAALRAPSASISPCLDQLRWMVEGCDSLDDIDGSDFLLGGGGGGDDEAIAAALSNFSLVEEGAGSQLPPQQEQVANQPSNNAAPAATTTTADAALQTRVPPASRLRQPTIRQPTRPPPTVASKRPTAATASSAGSAATRCAQKYFMPDIMHSFHVVWSLYLFELEQALNLNLPGAIACTGI